MQFDATQLCIGAAAGAGLLMLGLGAIVFMIEMLPVVIVVGGMYVFVKSTCSGGDEIGK